MTNGMGSVGDGSALSFICNEYLMLRAHDAWLGVRNRMKKEHRKLLHGFSWVGFVIYLVVMVYFLFFSEQMGRIPSDTYHYNLKPFTEIQRYLNNISVLGIYNVVLNLAGNVVCFMPLGFVLPIITNRNWGVVKVTVMSFLASLFVEVLQLVSKLGSCDVDDLILNTLGGFLGYLLFILCRGIYRLSSRRKRKNMR